ncbi:hypothetical protein [Bradyrhizobium sp.]|uniref:hypothetical protein n=1 Tax=Bradyrhizobium sp. TaxID=376 RepID=UPI003C77BDF9
MFNSSAAVATVIRSATVVAATTCSCIVAVLEFATTPSPGDESATFARVVSESAAALLACSSRDFNETELVLNDAGFGSIDRLLSVLSKQANPFASGHNSMTTCGRKGQLQPAKAAASAPMRSSLMQSLLRG